jgi:RNA polymerase sigma-70 factor (ECF subfamily)
MALSVTLNSWDGSDMLAMLFRRLRTSATERRLEELFTLHLDFVSRSLRNLGVPERDIDDATQQVFIVLSRKLDAVRNGSERAFLFRTSIHVAAHARRSLGRKREALGEIPEIVDERATADDLVDEQRARELLDAVLSKLAPDVRAVFVLYEIEHMTMAEIASTLELPPGTVASRLRRGRELFQSEVERLRLAAARRAG